MSRALLIASALALTGLAPSGVHAQERWTVEQHLILPASGQPLDLATFAEGHERTVRVRLSGTVSFLYDGSQIDAMGRSVNGTRDVSAGPYVVLPPGAVAVESDAVAHRYTFDIPRAAEMPIRFNIFGLATGNLMTTTEVQAQLVGAIEVEHMVSPPPPPTATEQVVRQASERASGLPWYLFAGVGLGVLFLLGVGLRSAMRRPDPIAQLVRRAVNARDAIGKEVVSLGPAFDPVAASAERLLEVARQHAEHHGSIERALSRTAGMSSDAAAKRRLGVAASKGEVRAKLEGLVARLEDTATELAGRNADTVRARGVEALLQELGSDLDAAVQAEEELAL